MTKTATRIIRSDSPCKTSSNRITNTKCSLAMFPIKMIQMQFESISSVFFFLIIIIQLSPKYRITPFMSSFFPWAFIFSINIFKEARENYLRYLKDKEINLALYKKLTDQSYTLVESQSIKAGDIILIEKGQRVPADCLLLKSEELSGEIFIRTDQLDGETDWKRRNSLPETQQCSIKSLKSIEAEIELPSKDIYSFNGKLIMKNFVAGKEENNVLFSKTGASPMKSTQSTMNLSITSPLSSPKNQPFNVLPKENPDPSSQESLNSTQIVKSAFLDENKIVEVVNSSANIPLDDKVDEIGLAENGELENKGDLQNEQDLVDKTSQERTMGVDLENTIWANTVVSSSEALCLVIYIGNDTRSMMNTLQPRNKTGIIDRELDRFVMAMAIVAFTSAFLFAWMKTPFEVSESWMVICLRFVIIFSYVIPISLKFMFATARWVYMYRLSKTPGLSSIKVMTNTLQEELARISFFLTDKTGTLTKNEMLMRKLHIGTICYNADNKDDITRSVCKVLEKSGMRQLFWKKTKSIDTKIFELLEALSICNNVNPIESETGLTYQASSPDEIAMVNYASEIGLQMVKRDNFKIVIRDSRGVEMEYKVLYVFPFNSDTKRMGIIIQKDGQYVFFEKGADTVMKNIIRENDWIEEEADNMAREGLRTLVIAKKVISNAEFKKFSKAYEKAKTSLTERNELMLVEQCSLEHDLDAIGLTGVEDKLQDKVRQTLECIRNAGIKIWMLTGDKIETAISIAFSSRLLTKNDQYMVISKCKSKAEADRHLDQLGSRGYNSLVIDGESVAVMIEHCFDRFIDLAKNLHCLIGCRYSPTQKALMASRLRIRAQETVLCIGDGGNDVSMITSADVGIGLEGKEGSQASLAADFSLKSFSDVADLMFFHGRRCYKNSAKMSHIIFHRGIIQSTIQAIFCALIRFYPISILQGKLPTLFILITIFPLFWIIFDEDISRDMAMKYPELYKELREHNLLNLDQFLLTVWISVFQAATFILYYYQSKKNEIFSMSIICFTNLIINEQLMVVLSVWENLNYVLLMMCLGSIMLYLVATRCIEELYTFQEVLGIGFHLISMNIVAIMPKLFLTIYNIYVKPASHIKLRTKK